MSRAASRSLSRSEVFSVHVRPAWHASASRAELPLIRKRSISLQGHRTSFSIEDEFLTELKLIAGEREMSLASLIAEIDEARPVTSNLSSALRLFVLAEAKKTASNRDKE